jgi:hypothetical protein
LHQINPLVIQPQAMTQQATRHARRVYVGGLPPTANEQVNTYLNFISTCFCFFVYRLYQFGIISHRLLPYSSMELWQLLEETQLVQVMLFLMST